MMSRLDDRLERLERAAEPEGEAFRFAVCTSNRHACPDPASDHFTLRFDRRRADDAGETDGLG